MFLKPVSIFPDPFRKDNGYLVLCENFLSDRKTPARGNWRTIARKVLEEVESEDPWFGIEQEYFMMVRNYINEENSRVLGFPKHG